MTSIKLRMARSCSGGQYIEQGDEPVRRSMGDVESMGLLLRTVNLTSGAVRNAESSSNNSISVLKLNAKANFRADLHRSPGDPFLGPVKMNDAATMAEVLAN